MHTHSLHSLGQLNSSISSSSDLGSSIPTPGFFQRHEAMFYKQFIVKVQEKGYSLYQQFSGLP